MTQKRGGGLRKNESEDEEDVLPNQTRDKPDSEGEVIQNDSQEGENKVEQVTPELETQPRRSARDRRPVQRYSPGSQAANAVVVEPNFTTSETMRARAEPKIYKMAMKSPNAEKWKEACTKEIQNIMDIEVWEIVDRPTNSPVVGGRWHFKLKLNPNGTFNKYKAQYVAK